MAQQGGSDAIPRALSVSGTVEFQDVREPAYNVTLYVRVQDTPHADASATTIAEMVIRGVNIVPGGAPIPFTVDGIPPNPGALYTVRVLADVDGDGRVSRGDFVSTQSSPLETGKSVGLRIAARRVG
jgi:hypothetical protein